ncbi:glycoside hydrolase family 27 protein [Daedalea quercina L-15889]|uniref:alpha-galactosidase n=1 Tax=Daedalea quercina L-15889 TaxID=1314783 RepID=A0A165UEP2_9APHY|nr:glycoside hydrolase family 27 protein [Daedalea quercina L-15889]
MATSSLLLVLALQFSGILAHNNGLALTPQMGWNTWNHLGCDISEDIVGAAQAFIAYGLPQYGVRALIRMMIATDNLVDINMDDCECESMWLAQDDSCVSNVPWRR